MKFRRSIALILCFLPRLALTAEPGAITPEAHEFFEDRIRPILVENCYECHTAGSPKMKGGLALSIPSGVRLGGDSGPKIATGDPETSLLVHAIRYRDRELQMPPRSPLPARAVKDLETWIAMGAPDPRDDDPGALEQGPDVEEGRNFWSFRDPAHPSLPATEDPRWSGNPVDAFIFRKLAEAGLPPAPPADRRTWIRRATLDLTGLPPTPAEIDAFLSDTQSGARERVIDRLLASEAYGERWGRHWLDVARYSDSNGLDENLAFGNAWRYRDYVVDSFNRDKPFDRFLIEQIAGDLVSDPTEESITGTGFLALGARVLAEKDREKLRMDVIDEQIDTTGKAFLGLTLGCARCHDHKFDPILESDYYSLAAIFKNTESFATSATGAIWHWYEHDFASEEQKAAMKEWDDRIAEAKKAARTFQSEQTSRLRTEARDKAVDYLVAVTRFEQDASLSLIADVAAEFDLHPRILHHCRQHLFFHRDDEVFEPWWQYRRQGDIDGLRGFYEDRFAQVTAAFEEARQGDPKAKTIEDPVLEAFRAALHDNSGFLAVPAKPEHAFDPETLAELHRLEEEARIVESHAPDLPSAMGVTDVEEIADSLPVHIRGSHLNLGEPVPRAVPAVFSDEVAFPAETSGRLELAHWMASPEHPLTARVFVNRVWGWHFGTGLVKTTENFGTLGDRPSHPELLDWLATRFVASGWRLKDLHRLIMTSETYGMATGPLAPEAAEIDPGNRLLSAFPVRRLDAEQIRDSILAVSGRLDSELGGKTIPLRNRQMVFNHTSEDHTSYESVRRSLYLPVVRNHIFDWLQLFDYPDPTMPTGSRSSTTIAPQALLLLNSDLARDSAAAFASRLAREAGPALTARIDRAWHLAYGRPPRPAEVAAATEFLEGAGDRGWNLFCQSLIASSEFLYVP